MKFKKTATGSITYCEQTPQEIEVTWFDVDFWRGHSAVTGSSKGRYTTWFVDASKLDPTQQQWVLRHYYRGGLIEKVSRDQYFFTSLKNTRAVAELTLLENLYQQGFPVPKPIAANVERNGLWYRADLIIERVDGAEDLVARLSKTAMTAEQWQSLGQCIARFHHHGVYHADLNAKNILITAEKFYLIDFDRGEIRTPKANWQRANLDRLLRSFRKELAKLPQLAFTEADWQHLHRAYHSALASK
ncbi:3-deoxy-D-manno-octulosonic acid kinase [Shewanella sp. Choline-02u-19]|jgi:3-deoxy-D-manno-octulosonic acid kinase|uniref:3-deoxy-D-manno-octulosonic acid kinase n=1 Tax=unclassified Shewanella TaxID=196818 RepID=UPI000C322FDF|nr:MULTISPECIES: 3-deoxy-D-manno-octulosonic acid kinase [unclassified Shewanella]PKG57659.1 3-deoxy-D-manno-octulosonic acid kinase [Shewanella sp. GutDb-MelDb]PKH58258.1 3-deoxy-D-manno-octulosonic acid kinase [Shewanella sp. Bg11-22]PKI29479.1 3-deoxy-D-manno-octulosonic acid kinase [Shewanella sp. Choline-02u-19]